MKNFCWAKKRKEERRKERRKRKKKRLSFSPLRMHMCQEDEEEALPYTQTCVGRGGRKSGRRGRARERESDEEREK